MRGSFEVGLEPLLTPPFLLKPQTGVLLCQQGQRMFPPPTAAERERCRQKVGPGEKNRRGGGAFGECRMMRG